MAEKRNFDMIHGVLNSPSPTQCAPSRMCPLRFLIAENSTCLGSGCAWWTGKECVLVNMAQNLIYLADRG